MMVYQDSAQLNFPKEKMVSCYADHRQIAKLRRGESGAYPDIKRAIKQALLHVAEDQANAGLSRLQRSSGGKAVVEEQWRENGDDINEPRSQQPTFPAEDSHLDDAQSPGSSSLEPQGKIINEPRSQQPPFPAEDSHLDDAQSPGSSSLEPQGKIVNEPRSQQPPFPIEDSHLDDAQSPGSSSLEPPGKIIDVLHERDIVSNSSPPVSDGRKQGVICQDSETLSDSTIVPPSTPTMSRDGGAIPKGDADAPEATMPHVTDALSDRRNAHSSPVERESPGKAMGNVKDPTLRLELCSASKEGDVEKVRSLLAQGCSIHGSSEGLVDPGKDAFFLAALNGRLDVLKLLLEHNCDVSKRSLKGHTALHLISFDPEIKPKPVIESLVVLLLDHGVPLEARNSSGSTALSASAYNGKISIAECLLEHGANIYSTDKNRATALHRAAEKGHHKVVALLISKGANIHTADKNRATALHWAAEKGHHKVVALLISKGANIHTADKNRATALHRAVEKGHQEVVAFLISKGANINSADKEGCTALHHAVLQGHHNVVALLISEGAPLETRTIRVPGRPPCTPLQISSYTANGSGECAKLLLQAGAAKEAITGFSSRRVLHIAARRGNLEVVNELLAFGVEIDAEDSEWRSALHLAKFGGQWRILEALLAKGADALLVNRSGNPPSKETWSPKVSQEDKEKCLKLLEDAEQAWLEKRRQGREKGRRKK